jgi:hypothetical protein
MQRLRRALVFALMAVTGLNIWTGNPLLALWVGSRVAGDSQTSMRAVGVVVAMMGTVGLALTYTFARLGALYDRLAGQESSVRHHVPWLRSMRGESLEHERERTGVAMTGSEKILVAMVILAFAAFEIWFFFYSSSPIDQRTGRE